MASVLLEGAPCPTNALQVVSCSTAHVISNDEDVIIANTTGLTITLPDNPLPGQRHTIMSLAGVTTTVAVSAAATTAGKSVTQTSIAASTFREYVYSPTAVNGTPTAVGQWISQALA